MTRPVLLLLNISNMASYPVSPYAFIQVPALARRAGIEMHCRDLLGTVEAGWAGVVEALIDRYQPAMILITLRNTDSFVAEDYEPNGTDRADDGTYFPIERTRRLIAAIRTISDLPITIGGFGFSLLAEQLMHYLRPDFGVIGGPDAFFARFDDVLAGRHAGIHNLL